MPVACIMFHAVCRPDPRWAWGHIAIHPGTFDNFLRVLKKARYASVLLPEYQDLHEKGVLNKHKVVALTFDDGYLDNWVYAAPLLQKYGFNGTVFVSSDFLDPGETPRPQWDPDDVSGMGYADGYLNAAELRALNFSGTLDVQAHAATHTWYPCGPRIVDFRHPGDAYHWMDWNAAPEEKWKCHQPPEDPTTWGEPVYEHAKSLAGPRFFPNDHIAEVLRAHVAPHGKDFFSKPGWRDELFHQAKLHQAGIPLGEMENPEAFQARMEREIFFSADLLNAAVDKKVRYLCWPGGGYSQELFDLAGRYYAGTTIASSDHVHPEGKDASGCFRLRRFGPLTVGSGASTRYLGGLANVLYLEEWRTGNRMVRLARGVLTKTAAWCLR